jgi:uncharacterized protein YbbC (DUF1343 family)
VVTDRDALDAPELGVEIASALSHLYPDRYKLIELDSLMVHHASMDAISAGQDPRRVAADWQDSLSEFAKTRARYLLY